MKRFILALLIVSIGLSARAFYDFCESPQDYNTFPASYDFKTEYWTEIPDYDEDNIKYHKKDTKKFDTPTVKKAPKSGETIIDHDENIND